MTEEDLNHLKENLEWCIFENKFALEYYTNGTGHNPIERDGAELIADKIRDSEIEELAIGQSFTDDGLDVFFEALKNNISNIKVVTLYHNPLLTEDQSKKFGQLLTTMPNLTSLEFIESVTDIGFPITCEAIQSHPSLKSLKIKQDIAFTPAISSTFKGIELLQGLEDLTLEECVTESVAETIFGPGNKISASSISLLDRGELTTTGAGIIGANLGPKVKKFKFDVDQYNNDGSKEEKVVAILDALESSNTLETLDLSGSNIQSDATVAKLGEFLLINSSVKALLLNNNSEFAPTPELSNALKNSSSLEMLSIDGLAVNGDTALLIWNDIINGSKLSKVVFGEEATTEDFKTIKEAIEATPTLEKIEIKDSENLTGFRDLIDSFITKPLAANKTNIAKLKAVAKEMLTKFGPLGVAKNMDSSSANLSKIDLSKAENFVNIVLLNALENGNPFILSKALGENAWLVNSFLNAYKNNNGLVLTGVHKSKDKFEAQDDKKVSPLVFLPTEILAKIFSFISVEEMYKIATSKETTSKVEEVTDGVTLSGTYDLETDS